jgi:hypothetical protein
VRRRAQAARAAAHGHAHGQDVHVQQVQDAADHRQVRAHVLDVVDDERDVGLARQGELPAVMASTAAPRACAGLPPPPAGRRCARCC